MGAAYFIIAKDKPEELDLFINGKALARADRRLRAAAKEAGVPELESFFSVDPQEAAEFLEDPEEIAKLPAEQWFSPAEGLASVRALVPYFSQPEDAAILEDLREFEEVLTQLEQSGLLWHLGIDY